MRRSPVLLLSLLVAAPSAGGAQISAEVTGGVLGTSILVRDSIVQELTVRPALAPSFTLSLGTTLTPVYQLAAGVRWTRSDLVRHEGELDITIMPLTVWSGFLGLRRRLTHWATVQGMIGAIKYAPSDADKVGTLFQDDAPLFAAAGLSTRVEHQLGSRMAAGLQIAYDVHRFGTQALRASGVTGQRTVHRVSVEVTFRRSVTNARP